MNVEHNAGQHINTTPVSKDPNERKRVLSDGSEATGVSPEQKRALISNVSTLTMPDDSASGLEWNKTLYLKIDEMCAQVKSLRESLDFSNGELAKCKQEVAVVRTEIDSLKTEINLLKNEKEELREQCKMVTENQIKFEMQMKEQNLIFDGISETHGETPALLHRKIVSVLNHMIVLTGNGPRIPFNKIKRLGPFIVGRNRPVLCHFSRYCDVEIILRNRSQLPENVYVREDFPSQIEDRRRILRPIFNAARKFPEYKGKCRLVCDS